METIRLQFGSLTVTPAVINRLEELDFTVQELRDAITDHKSSCDGEPAVYVGTYGKYNDGSLQGLWIDLSSFYDYEEFITFCQAIHSDEPDPELMAQDFEAFPKQWYNEGFISEDDFDHIKEYSEMCEKHGQDAVDDYMEFNDNLRNFEEAYCGEWDSEEDFARHIIDECYYPDKEIDSLFAQYFNYEAYADDLFRWDYNMGAHNNVFRVL